jgi:hypothetical protein
MTTAASPEFKRSVKRIIKSYSRTQLRIAIQVWLLIIACGVLAYFGMWRWAWLSVALLSVKMLADIGLGVVICLTNLLVVQAKHFDTDLPQVDWNTIRADIANKGASR